MVKMSISVHEETATRVRELAAARGVPVSALVDEALAHAVRQAAMREFLDDYQREHGRFTEEDIAAARAELGWS